MIRRTPVSTRTDTLCPYTTLCRSDAVVQIEIIGPPAGADRGGALSEGVVLIGGQRDAVARDPGWASAGPVLQRSVADRPGQARWRSEEHTSELQSLMRISYAVFCLKKKNYTKSTGYGR